MNGFKIHYGEYDHDCWGKPEWCGWYEYDNVIYVNEDTANKMLLEAKKKYTDRQFELYEVEIK